MLSLEFSVVTEENSGMPSAPTRERGGYVSYTGAGWDVSYTGAGLDVSYTGAGWDVSYTGAGWAAPVESTMMMT